MPLFDAFHALPRSNSMAAVHGVGDSEADGGITPGAGDVTPGASADEAGSEEMRARAGDVTPGQSAEGAGSDELPEDDGDT